MLGAKLAGWSGFYKKKVEKIKIRNSNRKITPEHNELLINFNAVGFVFAIS